MKLSRRKRKNIKLFRISHPGDAWDWVDWQWTGAERFDDPEAEYRVLYTGKTLRACLLEVLAHFRPDPALVADMEDIVEDDNATLTAPAGEIGYEWAADRRIGTAHATAHTCVVTETETIAWLRATLKVTGLDAAMLKDARERKVTQAASRALFEETACDALEYRSRHGDSEQLWAIYEREPNVRAACLSRCETLPFEPAHPDVVNVFKIFGLTWKAVTVPAAEDLPIPVAPTSVEEFYAKAFPETNGVPTPMTALGCAWLWLDALARGDETAAKALTHQPEEWLDKDWRDAHSMQAEAIAFPAATVSPVEDAIPPNIAQAVHVPLGGSPLSDAPSGAYEIFGNVPNGTPPVYIAVINLKGTREWRVTGVGIEAPMPSFWFNGPSPRAGRGDLAKYHLDALMRRLEKIDGE